MIIVLQWLQNSSSWSLISECLLNILGSSWGFFHFFSFLLIQIKGLKIEDVVCCTHYYKAPLGTVVICHVGLYHTEVLMPPLACLHIICSVLMNVKNPELGRPPAQLYTFPANRVDKVGVCWVKRYLGGFHGSWLPHTCSSVIQPTQRKKNKTFKA